MTFLTQRWPGNGRKCPLSPLNFLFLMHTLGVRSTHVIAAQKYATLVTGSPFMTQTINHKESCYSVCCFPD